jgi:hypothetical protein
MHRSYERCMQSVEVRRTEGKRLCGRPRHRWVVNTKIDVVGCKSMDCIHLAEEREQ